MNRALQRVVASVLTGGGTKTSRLLQIHCRKLSTMDTQGMIPPPKSLTYPMNFPRKTLLGPGPSNASPRILAASALPMLGHLHPEFLKVMDEIIEGVQYAFQTRNPLSIAVAGTGHAAMEATVANMVEPGDVVLVASNGLWGERFGEMAERHGGDVKFINKPQGKVFTLQEVEEGLSQHKPVVMFITHGESSGGTEQPLEGMGDLCHKHKCLLLVDSVAAMGGVPLHMDKWGIDVLYSGSQKVLSAPPGASPISFNQAAWDKIRNRKTKVRSYYLDMLHLANYWGVDKEGRRYHHTGPIASMYALREALAVLADEGLEASWKRHKEMSEMLQKGVEELGLQMVVSEKEHRLPTINAVVVPAGVNWKQVTDYAMKNYLVEIAGGLGGLAGKVWRIGLMGYNSTPDNVRLALRCLKEGIAEARANPPASL